MKKSIHTQSRMSLLLASSLLIGMPLAVNGALTANFADGTGTDPSSQFIGAAGDGWTTPWALHSVNAEFEQAVSSANPFSGSFKRFDTDNYLSVNMTSSGTAAKRTSLSRGYSFGSHLPADTSYEIAFNIRFDSLGNMGSGEYVGIFDSTTQHQTGTSHGNQSWGLVVLDRQLTLYNGDRAGKISSISTGITVSDSSSYGFVITVDPTTSSWYISISHADGIYESAELGFRTAIDSDADRYVLFNTLQTQSGDSWEYSLDGLTIIPEPGTAVGLVGVAILGFVVLRHRRR